MVVIKRQYTLADLPSPRMYDLSFMYSKQCDLDCSFCMYSSSPDVHDRLDLFRLRLWLRTIPYQYINAIGIYGGEPWLFMEENGWILDNVSRSMPRFIITNGTWSKNIVDTTKFMLWVEQHRLEVFVSGTDQHVSFQDRTMLEDLAARYPKIVHLKKADTQILPMGKLFGAPVKCTAKCMRQDVPTRLAVQPDGSIIYQTCDGVYPVIGSLNDSFSAVMTRVEHYIKHGFGDVCPYYEGACQRKS